MIKQTFKSFYAELSKYALVYLLFPWLFSVCRGIVNWVYNALAEIAPSLFAVYNQVTEKELYQALSTRLSLIAVFCAVAIINFLCAIYDNERYERLVTETDGLYKIPSVLPSYLKGVLACDICAPLLPQLLAQAVALVSFPKKAEKFAEFYFEPQRLLTASFGFAQGFLLLALAAVLARLAATPFALKRYRGLWLTGFED